MIPSARVLVLGLLLVAPVGAETQETVALTCWISGSALIVRPPAEKAVPLEIYHRLKDGDEIRTRKGSEVRLVFRDGRRVAITASSRAKIEASTVKALVGSVRELPAVPTVLNLPPIDRAQDPGTRPGASRIRAGRLDGFAFDLHPRDQVAVLPQATRLRFSRVPGEDLYDVAIFDAGGRRVFSLRTPDSSLTVPPEILTPGTTYHWRVRSDDQKTTFGTALFVTPPEAMLRARERLAAEAETTGHPDLLALLADVDRRLGLVTEACRGLEGLGGGRSSAGGLGRAMEAFGCDGLRPGESPATD